MTDWQPIETAPKDGTYVLVYQAPYITTAKWIKGDRYRRKGWWSLAVCGEYAEDSQVWPTHWMPLPNPPETPQ